MFGSTPRRTARSVIVSAIALLAMLFAVAPAMAAGTGVSDSSISTVTLGPSPSHAGTVVVSWVPGGSAATVYKIEIADDSNSTVASALCWGSDCTSRTLPSIPPRPRYQAIVTPFVAGQWTTPVTSSWWTPTSACDSGNLCATIDSQSNQGAAELRAQGFLHGGIDASQQTTVAALHPSNWRLRVVSGDYGSYDRAVASGADVTLLLSDAWWSATYSASRGGALAPWSDWTQYRSWVHSYVSSILSTGRHPTFWDVQNEPGHAGYLNALDTASWNSQRILDQFKIAYQEITALDPQAQVIGPSSASFYPTAASCLSCVTQGVDLQTFLDYAVANNIKPAAVVWHEIEQSLSDMGSMPVNMIDHIAQARRMLVAHGLNSTEVFVNEYGAPWSHTIPGWSVGNITALEAANVDGANRSCWWTTAADGSTYSECEHGLDGLFNSTGDRLGDYWVHSAYGGMNGTRLQTSTSESGLSVYSTRDDAGVVKALVGRHEECSPLVITAGCTNGLVTQPAQPLTLSVTNATRSMRAVVTRIPADGGPLAAPVPVSDTTVSPVGTTVVVPIPGVNDGDAYSVTLTPQGDPITGPTASLATSGPGGIDLGSSKITFYRGADAALWYRVGTSTVSLGGYIVGSPDAATLGSGRLAVVARGTDDQVWGRIYSAGKWGNWFPLGGKTIDSPSIVGSAGGRIDVFMTGQTHTLWHRSSADGVTWTSWESLGGYLTSGPDATSWGGSHLDVVGRGRNGEVRLLTYEASQWSTWKSLGANITGAPAAGSPATNNLDIVVRAWDNSLWTRSWNGSTWSAWTAITSAGATTGSDPDAFGVSGRETIFIAGGNGTLLFATRPSGATTFGAFSAL